MKLISAIFWIILISGAFIGVMMMHGLSHDEPPTPLPIADISTVEDEGLYCYAPYGSLVEPKHVLQGSVVLIEWKDKADMPEDTDAYARWSIDYDANMSYCIITATMPVNLLGDPRMDALGHELLHCITGEFHP